MDYNEIGYTGVNSNVRYRNSKISVVHEKSDKIKYA